MESHYFYVGHSSFGNPQISQTTIPSDLSDLNRYMYITIPDNFRIITLCNFGKHTTTRTTTLMFGALKNITDFKQLVTNMFDYTDDLQKSRNILVFSKNLVSNFLVWSLGQKQISGKNIFDCLKTYLSKSVIEKIIDSWKLFSARAKPEKAWSSSGFLSKLYQFDFITEEIVDLVLVETKINVSIYKSGDRMKFMNFDELSTFFISNNLTIFNSGIFTVDDYKSTSQICQTFTKEQFEALKKPGETFEQTKIRIVFSMRSRISVEKNFPRFFNMNSLFEKFEGGTFIIPSCGTINKDFNQFFDTYSLDRTEFDFFK